MKVKGRDIKQGANNQEAFLETQICGIGGLNGSENNKEERETFQRKEERRRQG